MFRFCFWAETYNHVVSVQDGHALLNEARGEGFESMFLQYDCKMFAYIVFASYALHPCAMIPIENGFPQKTVYLNICFTPSTCMA